MHIAERLRKAIEQKRLGDLTITASFGVSSITPDTSDAQALVQQADEALYAAKRSGRNRVCRWDDLPADVESAELALSRTAASLNETEGSSLPFTTAKALFSVLAFRDATLAEHSQRVADFCVQAGRDIMKAGDVYILEVAALIHEIGRVGIPDVLMHQQEQPSGSNPQLLQVYDRVGIEIAKAAFSCDKLISILEHYRAPFSSGDGDQIPLGARLMQIADVYDLLVSTAHDDVHRTSQQAVAELRELAGDQLDPRLVERFIHCLNQCGADRCSDNGQDADLHLRRRRPTDAQNTPDQILNEFTEMTAQRSETALALETPD